MLGIGVFAIPSGLIGGAFIEEMRQEWEEAVKKKCKVNGDFSPN